MKPKIPDILRPDTIGQRIQAVRARRSLTLRDFEKLTGVSNAYLSQLENERVTEPSITIVKQIADGLNINPAWLAFGSHDWVKDKDYFWCLTCGYVRRRDGKNKPCCGPVSISLR